MVSLRSAHTCVCSEELTVTVWTTNDPLNTQLHFEKTYKVIVRERSNVLVVKSSVLPLFSVVTTRASAASPQPFLVCAVMRNT